MRLMIAAAITVSWLALPEAAMAQRSLPDPALTPGATNPAVTEKNIAGTICVPGWTRTVRPPAEVTYKLKRQLIRTYGYADRRLGHYELDHLVPLELGGATADPYNLWPEPKDSADGWTADRKDELEFALNRLVCAGRLSLGDAQQAIATDWIAAYRRYARPLRSGRSTEFAGLDWLALGIVTEGRDPKGLGERSE